MTDAAILAFGSALKLHEGGTGTAYSTIAELRSIPFPQAETPRIDVSTHDNDGPTREYVAGLIDFPAVQFQINYLPANATHNESTGLVYLQRNPSTIRTWKVAFNSAVGTGTSAKVITFSAYVAGFVPEAPVDNVYTATVTLQPTATPTYGSS